MSSVKFGDAFNDDGDLNQSNVLLSFGMLAVIR